jgi:hypothetical protein
VLSWSINEWINNFIVVQAQDGVTLVLLCRIDKVMAGLRTNLENAYKASGGKKVTII